MEVLNDEYLQQLFLGKLIIILGFIGVIVYVFLLLPGMELHFQSTQVLMCKGLQGYG